MRIFLPSLALGLLFLGVAGFWAFASWRTGRELDAWLDREAALGRTWTCPDRAIAGFPFRLEVSCGTPSFTGVADGRSVSGSLGRVMAVAQIYNPNHVIVEAQGPLAVRAQSGETLDLDFTLARASIMGKPGAGLDRFSLEISEPRLKIASSRLPPISVGATMADFHIRRTPDRPTADGAFDVASLVQRASVPMLDQWLGGSDTTDATVLATITRAEPLAGRGLPVELERWRTEGGRLQLSQFSVTRGTKRVDAAGTLNIDELHRLQGRLDLTVAGLDEVLQSFGLSPRNAAIGGLIASVLGGGRKSQAQAAAPQQDPAGKGVMLPLRLDNGKVMLGPIPVANLVPLY
ncbi:DUF2125 domain-containing protein [uncultured Alsobacter sp.]|uniref:DUF2125 domain-containing protein n=1 Tax=uncultured Alsobacter sp. TaxID=1748258 RepID=UPI0025F97C40|nr:DUF2125 domain-containing protein [uncultured Alsobacter sp.]